MKLQMQDTKKGVQPENSILLYKQLCLDISPLLSNNNPYYIQFYSEQELIIYGNTG